MHCPRCNAVMTLRFEGLCSDIPVHRCPSCAALWMSPAGLDRLDDKINVDAAQLDWRPIGEDRYACTDTVSTKTNIRGNLSASPRSVLGPDRRGRFLGRPVTRP